MTTPRLLLEETERKIEALRRAMEGPTKDELEGLPPELLKELRPKKVPTVRRHKVAAAEADKAAVSTGMSATER